jgi:hypothetical protein
MVELHKQYSYNGIAVQLLYGRITDYEADALVCQTVFDSLGEPGVILEQFADRGGLKLRKLARSVIRQPIAVESGFSPFRCKYLFFVDPMKYEGHLKAEACLAKILDEAQRRNIESIGTCVLCEDAIFHAKGPGKMVTRMVSALKDARIKRFGIAVMSNEFLDESTATLDKLLNGGKK